MFLRLTSSTLALTVLTAPAFALTPEEVWNAWTAEYGRTGYTITEGSRDLAGEVLTLTDVTFAQESEGERTTIRVPRIVLTGTGDGNVRSSFGEAMTLEMVTRNDEDQPVTLGGTVRTPGMEVLSSGDASARTDKVTAPSIVFTLDSIDLPEGEDLSDVASVTLTDLAAESLSKDGGRSIASTSSVAKLDYAVDYADAEGSVKASGSVEGIEGSGDVTLPAEGGMDFAEQMNAALKAGATLSGTLKLGAGSHDLAFRGTSGGTEGRAEGGATDGAGGGAEENGTMKLGLGGAELGFRIGQDGLAYQGAMSDLSADMTATGMPAPVSYALQEATFDIQGPVMASDTPAPFKFAYSLGGLTLADEVWALFDPAKQLPRDPASLDIDLTGQVRLTADLFDPAWREAAASPKEEGAAEPPAAGATGMDDPEAVEGPEAEVPAEGPVQGEDATAGAAADAAAPGDAPADAAADEEAPMPFEVTELTINQFALDAAGVKAEATGKLTAPEGGDISEPLGSITARYEGVNGLIDKLVAMGLISQDEVMGYRMMLTMFARPAEGTDVLTTELQFNAGGEIIANGQKIK